MFDLFFPKHWSTLKKLIWLKAAALSSAVQKTVSGAILSIKDALAMPAIALSVDIEPVQDLYGYNSPWPAGGGANIWDEQWEEGTLDVSTGENTPGSGRIRCKNYIPVLPNTTYCYVQGNPVSQTTGRVCFYDSDKQFISGNASFPGGSSSFTSPKTFTTPANAYFMKFSPAGAYGSTYGNNIAINYPSTVATYAPYSNICPITGWTGANVTHTGANIWGGEKMANDMVAAVNNSTYCTKSSDTNGNYVTMRGNSAVEVPLFTGPFKANTRYTFIFKVRKSNTNAGLNLCARYTDGTEDNVSLPSAPESGTVYTAVFTTSSTKSLKEIRGKYISGIAYFYYESCGWFTGVLTKDDFAAYSANTISITFPTPPGTVYGGTLDVTNGVLTVDRAIVTRTSSDVASGTPINTVRFGNVSPHMSGKLQDLYAKSIANCAKYREYSLAQPGNYYITGTQSDGGNAIIMWKLPSGLTFADKAAVDAWLAEHPFVCVYPLHVPQVYQLTAQQIDLLLGENNLWADTGDTTLTYMADGRVSDIEALGILLAGRYVNTGAADEATDAEALNILLGGNR